ncbi:MAG: hypothetical protein QOE92_1028 [Chloroflexota bacterium]|nr:hypothetical protein [Chloroflexota bacterium]
MKKLVSLLSSSALALAAGALSGPLPASADTTTNCAGLQAALDAAVDNDVITLDDTILCPGNFTLPQDVDLTLQGHDANAGDGFDAAESTNSMLSGSMLGNVVIQNLTFQNGAAGTGAAINLYNSPAGQATLRNSRFYSNGANSGGFSNVDINIDNANPLTITGNIVGAPGKGNLTDFGGALLAQTQGSIVFTDNQVRNNTATTGAYGAGAELEVLGQAPTGGITVSNNIISSNSGVGGVGGGLSIHSVGSGAINVTGNTFSNNSLAAVTSNSSNPTNQGGGLFVQAFSPDAALNQSHNVFAGNAIGRVTKGDTNVSFDYGGGGEYAQAATISSVDDTFVNNSVEGGDPEDTAVGGGLAVQGQAARTGSFASVLTGYNMVVANNSVGAGGEGGGIYTGFSNSCTHATDCPSEAHVFDSTITANSVGAAGGASGIAGDDTDTAEVVNSIVALNTGNQKQVNGQGTITVKDSDACQDATTPYAGAGNICTDPLLENPAANNVHQTAASPTIDAGDSTLVPAQVHRDYEGDTRVQGAAVDMGADEVTPQAPTLPLAGAGPRPVAPSPLLALLGLPAIAAAGYAARRRRRRA